MTLGFPTVPADDHRRGCQCLSCRPVRTCRCGEPLMDDDLDEFGFRLITDVSLLCGCQGKWSETIH
jgi:hypothetical protein